MRYKPGSSEGMTPTRRKPRKLLRRAFTVLTVLFLAGYVASGWYELQLWGSPPTSIEQGVLVFREVRCWYYIDPLFAIGSIFPSFKIDLMWPPFASADDIRWIALWPAVTLLLGLQAFWHWRIWRYRLQPGCCPTCGYDLRGCVDGRCSECGTVAENVRR